MSKYLLHQQNEIQLQPNLITAFIRVSNTWLGGQSWVVKMSDWAPRMAVENVKLEGGHKFGHS